jgi:cell division protein FtsW (lipid II flippase)
VDVAPGAKRRRNLELVLLLFAIVVCGFADASAELGLNGKLDSGFLVQVLGLAALALAAHLVVRRWAPYADPLILPLAVILTGLGLVLIHRLDYSYIKVYGSTAAAPNQVMWTAIAVVVFAAVIVLVKHHRVLSRYTYLLMAVSLVALVAPAFFSGDQYGARRWIHLGPLSFQPGEFTKLAIIVFFAGYLMANRDALALVGRKFMGIALPRGRNMGPILVVWAVSLVVLVFESDLGTSLIFFGAFIVMLYIATERTGWVVLGALMAVGGAVAAGTLVTHVKYRVNNWLDPMAAYSIVPGTGKPPTGSSPQLAESLFSLGHGGLLGTGLGRGDSWLIAFAGRSDWILATVGEELGTAGIMVVLVLYLLLGQRGMRTAVRLTDPFGKLLAAGLAAALVLQVFVVGGGVIGLIPQTGKALPFLAQGGSSTVANWLMIALLIKLSDASGRAEMEPKPDPNETLTISAEEIARARAEMEQTGY